MHSIQSGFVGNEIYRGEQKEEIVAPQQRINCIEGSEVECDRWETGVIGRRDRRQITSFPVLSLLNW